MNTRQKIENLHRAAFAVEDDIRRGRMTMDCASIDALARRTNRGGFAALFDGDKVEILPLGGAEPHVREATKEENHAWETSYQSMAGETFRRAAEESHEVERKAAGRFDPIHTEGKGHKQPPEQKAPTSDAARKAKMTADARRYNQDAFDRNARIAAQMKERSKEIWKRRSA